MLHRLLALRYGIAFKLAVAMFALTATTGIVTAIGTLAFKRVSGNVETLLGKQVVDLDATARVVVHANALKDAVGNMLLARNAEDLHTDVVQAEQEIKLSLQGIDALQPGDRGHFTKRFAEVRTLIVTLADARTREFHQQVEGAAYLKALRGLSVEVSNALIKQSDDAVFEVAQGSEKTIEMVDKAFTGLVDNDFKSLQILLEMRAEINLLSSTSIALTLNPEASLASILGDLRASALGHLTELLPQAKARKLDADLLKKLDDATKYYDSVDPMMDLDQEAVRRKALETRQQIDKALAGATDTVVFNLTIRAQDVSEGNGAAIRGLLENQVAHLTDMAALNLAVKEVVSAGLDVFLATDEGALALAQDQLGAATSRLAGLAKSGGEAQQGPIAKLLASADADSGAAAVRRKTLDGLKQVAEASRKTSLAVAAIADQARALGTVTLSHVKDAGAEIATNIGGAQMKMFIVAGFSALVSCAAIAMVYLSTVRPLGIVTGAVERLSFGEHPEMARLTWKHGEIGTMVTAIGVFSDNLAANRELEERNAKIRAEQEEVVRALAEKLEAMAGGRLDVRLGEGFPEHYEALRGNFNSALAAIEDMVQKIAASGEMIDANSGEISSAVDDLARRTEVTAKTLQDASIELNELTGSVRAAAAGAAQVNTIVGAARQEAEQNTEFVQETINAMSEIDRSSSSISKVTEVIGDISFQTNLLALNAGIEAAKAGESGRGFGVVASEVRALAQRAAQAAKEISALVSESRGHVQRGVKLVDKTGHALTEITAGVSKISQHISEIASSADAQSKSISSINELIAHLDQVTQQNAAMFEQTSAATQSLNSEANELTRRISQFTVSSETVAEAPPHYGWGTGRAVAMAPRPAAAG